MKMNRGFLYSVGAVFSGTLIAQVIPIVGTMVLARIFDPAAFGVFSAWLGAVLFLGVVLTCRFETSLAVETDGQPRRGAVVMILITIGIMSFATGGGVALAALSGLEVLARLPLGLLLTAVPTAALVASTQVMQNWAAADGRYRHLAIMRVVQAISIVLSQLVFGLLEANAVGLGYGYLLGACFGLVVGVMLMPLERMPFSCVKAELHAYWRKHCRFPIYSLPADAVNTAAAQLPVLVVAARFGAETAGLLAMALRMLGAPMSLLAASVLDVFKRHAGQAYRERGECRAEYLNAFRMLVGIAAVAGVAIGFGAEPVFVLAFGDIWLGAGTMALWLLPRFVIGFIASPLSYMVYFAGKQHLDLIWQLALLAMTIATLNLMDSSKQALITYAIGYGGLYLVYLAMSYKFSLGSRL